MHIVSKVWNFLKTRRKLSLAAFVIILAAVGIGAFIIFSHVGVSDAHAQAATTVAAKPAASNPATATTGRGLTDKIVEYIATILLFVAQFFIQITIFILRFIIEVGAYNGYIDSNAVNYGWIMVRDVTNMFFVIILLVIAFGTILGLEQYEYKKLLFKMIAAAVIVNFSRTICGLIIDIAQVIMVTFINGVAATAGGNLINMFNMQGVLKMAQTSGANITPKNVFLASLAALIFSAMAMATMFVFLIMLLARLITLWILIVLSPLAFVLNVIPQTQKYASQWWTEFGNNVVSGPIIAFFLWLAFVTAGSGNANADIVSGLPNQNLSVSGGTTESAGSAAAGISDAMDWTKMSSFAIAIGMLLVGAKMAQQLGVAGGAMMGKAVDFGKRVATVASGISAARWAGRKGLAAGKAAGKFVAMKAPIVGGEAWQRRGRAIAGRASLAYSKLEERRNVKAKEWEEKKGWRGVLGKVGAGLIESGGRKMKRATDWQDAAKTQKKVVEEMYGVGAAAGGVERMRGAIRLEKAEEMGAAVKAGAQEKERARMKAGEGEKENVAVREAQSKLKFANAQLKDNQEKYDAIVGRTDLSPEKRRDLMTDAAMNVDNSKKAVAKRAEDLSEAKSRAEATRGESFAAKQYAIRARAAVEGKAEAEILKTQREREEERNVARTKDASESARLGVPIHAREDQVLAKHAKEDVELENIPNYDKAMLNIGAIGGRIKELSGKTRTPEEDAKLEELRKKMGNAIQVNVANSAERGLDAIDKAMSSLELGGGVSAADDKISTVQSRILSSHLGREVKTDPNEIVTAMQEMESRFGHAYMEQMKDRFDNMSGQNAVNYAGAFKYDASGRVKATDASDASDLADIKRKREFARNRISSTNESRKGANGMMDQDAQGNHVVVSDEAIANVAKLLGGLSQQNVQNVPNENYQQVARALENNGERIVDVISAMSERSKSDLGGLAASLTKLAGEVKGEKTALIDKLSRAAETARQQLAAQRQKSQPKRT